MIKIFEIGKWVATEDGYGQVLKNIPVYIEDYEVDITLNKGELKRNLYLCKIICDFNGKPKKRNLINVYSSIDIIDKQGKGLVKKIKDNFKAVYEDYILFESKTPLIRQFFLSYEINSNNSDLIINLFENLRTNLPTHFTFKEFSKEFNKNDFPFKLNNFISYKESQEKNSNLTIRFDSLDYRVFNKEAIFNNIEYFLELKKPS